MQVPGLKAIDQIISDAIINVYQGVAARVDREVYARDITKKIRSRYVNYLTEITKYVTLIGHHVPIHTVDVFIEPEISVDPYLAIEIDFLKTQEEIQKRLRESRVNNNILPASRILSGNQLIVGQPGVGKSTLAKFIALTGAGHSGNQQTYADGQIPFYFAVKDLSSTVPAIHNFDWRLALSESQDTSKNVSYLESLIEQTGEEPKCYIESLMAHVLKQATCDHTEDFVKYILEKGKCCIIVDGLDEATDLLKELLIGSLTHINALYSGNKIFVFSRPKAVPDGIYGFSTIGIVGFDFDRVKSFANKWFQNQDEFNEFIYYLSNDKYLLDLARNPLLTSIICVLFHSKYPIPQKRSDLYGRCLDALMFELDRAKRFRRNYKYPFINEQKRKDVLSVIAFKMHEENIQTISRRRIKEYLSNVGFLKDIVEKDDLPNFIDSLELEHGVLIEWAKDVFIFPHRTFQEYLAAWFIERSRGEMEFVARLKTHYGRDLERWREITIILAYLLYDATGYIKGLMYYAFAYEYKESILSEVLQHDVACDPIVYVEAKAKGFIR